MPKEISIIIPVYNGEKFIHRCIDSILRQSFKALHIIAINDGSKDSSLKILREYEKNYAEFITILDQDNKGVAATRNRGLDLVSTKYVMFLDQDDFLDDNYCETHYSAAESGDYDIVISGFKRPGAGKRLVNRYVRLKDAPYAKYVCTAVFSKIHKTSFLRNNKIYVYPTDYGEDIAFTMHEYSTTKKIKILENYVGYNWSFNQLSVSNTSQKKMTNMLPLFMGLLDQIKLYDNDMTQEHEYYVLQTVVFFLLWTGKSSSPSEFKIVSSKVINWLNKNYPNHKKNKYIVSGPKGSPFLNRLAISGYILLVQLRAIPLFAKYYCKGVQNP